MPAEDFSFQTLFISMLVQVMAQQKAQKRRAPTIKTKHHKMSIYCTTMSYRQKQASNA